MGLHRDDSVKPGDTGEGSGGSSDLSRELTAAIPSPNAGSRGARASSIMPKTKLGHFEVLELLGAGGFGEVYRAMDTRLGRTVALKVLPGDFLEGKENRARFEREARALASLNHPNIAAIYSFEEIPGFSPSSTRHLIVMELVEGKTLRAALANGPLPVADALPIALQIIDALAEAHRAGILHRDIKSGNIALTGRGQVKVLDFGLAKLFGSAPEETQGSTVEKLTAEGASLGTITHMSPEQLLGKPVDRRSDLFSFGVVLYEMVIGRLPFDGSTTIAVADAILHAEPRDFGDMPLPAKLKAIIRRLLEKDPAKRCASPEEVHDDLKALEASLAPTRAGGLSRNAKIAVAVAVVAVAALAGWYWRKSSRERWALAQILEISKLVEAEEFPKAASLLEEARVILPNDTALEKLWMRATAEATLETDPPGAEVSIRLYRADENAWRSLGKTPLKKPRLPKGHYVWKLTRPGFAGVTFLDDASPGESLKLRAEAGVPPGMVPVCVHEEVVLLMPGLDHLPGVRLDDYLIDRTEVTNEEYAKFVDGGGYQKGDFWKQSLVRNGRTIPWKEAVASFQDATGRPGPATWEVGTFPKGFEKHPVTGVSWYEAAAYAEFAGKRLPTIYHWNWAGQPDFSMLIVPGSNFGAGTQPVGAPGTLSGFGTSDMAGNVKEWCWNESGEGRRFILGGGFGEPSYMFYDPDAQSPWDRRPNYGFRCMKLVSPPPPSAAGRIEVASRDYSKEKPVSEDVYEAYRGLYTYDKRALNARIEESETTEAGTREKVSFDAAYGGERVTAHLFLPKSATLPYQTVVFFPGDNAIHMDKIPPTWFTDSFIVRSGRALMFPIYKGTFERRDELKSDNPAPTAFYRDHMIAWAKDLGRSVDYLQTRKEIDSTKLAYWGFSWGAEVAPILLAVENRFKAAVLESGCFAEMRALPEADKINFVTRVKTPVLMLNGRYDFLCPVETSQLPFFRLLGTPDKDKRHVIYETGHIPLLKDRIREDLDWLDKYLGPVKK